MRTAESWWTDMPTKGDKGGDEETSHSRMQTLEYNSRAGGWGLQHAFVPGSKLLKLLQRRERATSELANPRMNPKP